MCSWHGRALTRTRETDRNRGTDGKTCVQSILKHNVRGQALATLLWTCKCTSQPRGGVHSLQALAELGVFTSVANRHRFQLMKSNGWCIYHSTGEATSIEAQAKPSNKLLCERTLKLQLTLRVGSRLKHGAKCMLRIHRTLP